MHADGAAVFSEGSCVRIGMTPEEPQMRRIVSWLARRGEDAVFATDALPSLLPEAAQNADIASGLLAISISQIHPSYVLWFRAEFIRTIEWAGEPGKMTVVPDEPSTPTRLHPRKSFASWEETVRRRSRPWTNADTEAAKGLRGAIINVVLRRAEQLADLTRELERSNKELEAFSYSISHDLRAPFRHIVGYAELLREREGGNLDDKSRHYLETIIDSAFSAGKLVDDLLRFSQMGRMTIQRIPVSTSKLVEEVVRSSEPDIGEPQHRVAHRRTAAREGRSQPAAAGVPEPGLQRHQVHPRARSRDHRDQLRAARRRPELHRQATTASASRWPMSASFSAYSSAFTASRSSRAPASGSRTCAGLSSAMAAGHGPRA